MAWHENPLQDKNSYLVHPFAWHNTKTPSLLKAQYRQRRYTIKADLCRRIIPSTSHLSLSVYPSLFCKSKSSIIYDRLNPFLNVRGSAYKRACFQEQIYQYPLRPHQDSTTTVPEFLQPLPLLPRLRGIPVCHPARRRWTKWIHHALFVACDSVRILMSIYIGTINIQTGAWHVYHHTHWTGHVWKSI